MIARLTFKASIMGRCLMAAGIVMAVTIQPAWAKTPQFEDIAYYTCTEAWEASSKSDKKFVEFALVLANYSVEKRNITFPDRKEAGDE